MDILYSSFLAGEAKNMSHTLPNFLIVGAAKSGTSAFYYNIKNHPDIFMSPMKEPSYFSSQGIVFPGNGPGDDRKVYIKDFDRYSELFSGVSNEKIIGEASTDTMYYHQFTVPHIKKLLGDPAIVFILRDPIERAFSSYYHLVRDKRETLTFEEGLDQETWRIANNWHSMWHYKKKSLYYESIKHFSEEFTRVKIILYDDYKKDKQALAEDVFKFLDIDPHYLIPKEKVKYNATGIPRIEWVNKVFLVKNPLQRIVRNIGSRLLTEDGWVKLRESIRQKNLEKPKIKSETRNMLVNYFREDIQKLSEFLQSDLNYWLK
jgi:hypothetical protein